jgi:hypothetical protein
VRVALLGLVGLEPVEFVGQQLGLWTLVEVTGQFAPKRAEVALHQILAPQLKTMREMIHFLVMCHFTQQI